MGSGMYGALESYYQYARAPIKVCITAYINPGTEVTEQIAI